MCLNIAFRFGTEKRTITPVTSIICIPLPIGVLGKRGTLEDKNTNDKCHGREWWVWKNQKYLVFNLNHLVKSQLSPPPMSINHVRIEKR